MRRTATWIAFAVVLTSAVPQFAAVASHSGNSPANQFANGEVHRGASVDWTVEGHSDAGETRDHYKIWVWQNAYLEIGDEIQDGVEGGAGAAVQRCVHNEQEPGWACGVERVWRGPANEVAPIGNDGVFSQDPLLLLSRFDGVLSPSTPSASPCRMDLLVAALPEPPTVTPTADSVKTSRWGFIVHSDASTTCFAIPATSPDTNTYTETQVWSDTDHWVTAP